MRNFGQLYVAYQGKRVAVALGAGFEVACIVVNVTVSYGNERVLVRPVAGQGTQWVSVRKCRIVPADWIGNAPDADEQAGAAGDGQGTAAETIPPAVRRRPGERHRRVP